MNSATQLSHSAQLVREFDRERFVTALFAPPDRREALMALYAFNVEVARIRESVREPMAGMIRLQWWRETLSAAEGGRPIDRHPVAAPLIEAVRVRKLSLEKFESILTAREQDLEPVGPEDMAGAEAYAEQSSGALSQLAAEILGANDPMSLAAARHVGIAWALLGQIRALSFHLSIGRLTLPEAELQMVGSCGADVMAGRAPLKALSSVAQAMGEAAARHLAQARRLAVSQEAIPALLLGTLADGHLSALISSSWNPMDSCVSAPRSRPLRLAWAHWRGRF